MHCNFGFCRVSKGAHQSPSLLGFMYMITEQTIAEIVNDYLEGTGQFLVDARVTSQNKIMVFIDGDNGVSIADCTRLSRHIEQQLDRDAEDFELLVSSVGVGHPLQLNRQYRNNVGRRLAVTASDGAITKGRLAEVGEEGIVLEKDKPGKGKKKKKEPDTDTENRVFIPFEKIEEARVQVSFK